MKNGIQRNRIPTFKCLYPDASQCKYISFRESWIPRMADGRDSFATQTRNSMMHSIKFNYNMFLFQMSTFKAFLVKKFDIPIALKRKDLRIYKERIKFKENESKNVYEIEKNQKEDDLKNCTCM